MTINPYTPTHELPDATDAAIMNRHASSRVSELEAASREADPALWAWIDSNYPKP